MEVVNINLLPWREQNRRRRGSSYFGVMILIIMLLCSGIFCADRCYVKKIHVQLQQKMRLSNELSVLQAVVEKRRGSKKYRERNQVYEALIAKNKHISDMLRRLSKDLPEHIVLTSIDFKEGKIMIAGKSGLQAALSILQRKIPGAHLVYVIREKDSMGFAMEVVVS